MVGAVTAFPSKQASTPVDVTEEENDQRTPGKQIWKSGCGQQEDDIGGKTDES